MLVTIMALSRILLRLADHNLQSRQHALLVGKIPDESADRQGKRLNQGRRYHNLLRPGLLGVLIDINHFQVVAALKSVLANRPYVLNGARGSRRGPGNE